MTGSAPGRARLLPDPADLIPDARDLIRAAYQLLDQAVAAGADVAIPRDVLAKVLRALDALETDPLEALARHWEDRPA